MLGRVEAHAKPSASAPTIGTLDNEAVEILEPADAELGHAEFAKVKLPTGKPGYVAASAIHGFLDEQLCVLKIDGTWLIVGYIGGGD